MGLSDVFKTAAQTAATVFSDVFSEVQYQAHVSTAYDVSSGVTEPYGQRHVVTMLFETYNAHQIDGTTILPTDVKATIPQNNLPPVPELHDTVHRIEANASVAYEVVNILQDPAGALWEFQLRKP